MKVALLTLMFCVGGCVTEQTVFVPSGETLVIGEDVKARVFYVDPATKKLVRSNNRVVLHKGWVVLPPLTEMPLPQ
jgi:hypothetical protein